MALNLKNVDPLIKKNAEVHHTSEFEVRDRSLILRRGQAFNIALHVDRPYDESKDTIMLIFEFAPWASTAVQALGAAPPKEELRDEEKLNVFSPEVPVRGVRASVTVTPDATTKSFKPPSLSNDTWDAVVAEFKDNELRIQVMIPANAQVGYWKMTVETAHKGSIVKNEHKFPHALLVLFNPWCSEDLVYLEDKELRKVYVQRELVRLCYHEANDMWNAAPFAAPTMQCVLLLLGTVSRIRPLERANPILVARALCRGINSDGAGGVDDNGLLVGNWGDYEDGTAPWEWSGSLRIFEQYLKERKSVKYGQCFTFAALMVSACRALGIPCRPVTAYSPGVDYDASLTIDETDEPQETDDVIGRTDFNWRFHVWNEVWLARPDLPDGYRGWQALDSCPVRAFRTGVLTNIGPVPVKAIKEGHVGIGYDAHIMFSAVNADVLNYREGRLYDISTDAIGEQVLTEKIVSTEIKEDNVEAEDITSLYKYPEGSTEERAAMKRAMCNVQCVYGDLQRGVIKHKPIPKTFELHLTAANSGTSFVRFDNLSGENRLVKYEVEALQEEEENDEGNEIGPLPRSSSLQNGNSTKRIPIHNGKIILPPRKSVMQKIVLEDKNDTNTPRNLTENSKTFLTIAVTRT